MKRVSIALIFCFIIIFILVPAAMAKEPSSPEMTVQQALEKAIVNSRSLQTAKDDIDRAYEVRQFYSDKVNYIPSGESSPGVERTFTSAVSNDINWQMAKRSYAAQEDSVAMQVYKAYDNLLQDMEKVKVNELLLKNADWKRRMADVSYKVGVLDMMGLVQANSNLSKAKSDYEASKKALADDYQIFNQLVGLWPEDRPILVDRPVFKKLIIDNLDAEVERAVESSPSVWLKDQSIDLAKLTLELFDLTNPAKSEPYTAKEIDVEKAKIAAKDKKEQTRQLVRTIYYKMVQLEDQYTSTQEKIKLSDEALRVARIKYDVGMATQGDVYTAEANLAQDRKSLLDISSQCEILSIAFRKPWTYAAA